MLDHMAIIAVNDMSQLTVYKYPIRDFLHGVGINKQFCVHCIVAVGTSIYSNCSWPCVLFFSHCFIQNCVFNIWGCYQFRIGLWITYILSVCYNKVINSDKLAIYCKSVAIYIQRISYLYQLLTLRFQPEPCRFEREI